MNELTADEARRIQLRAQGLLGAAGLGHRRGGVPALLEHLGAVQLDTISVLARSHELVPYARLGPVGRAAVEDAYWGGGTTFEYWAHAASILPISEWPSFAFRRRAFRARGVRWHKVSDDVCDEIRKRLQTDGPLTTKELGGAKAGGDWWQWSDHKIAIEWLLDIGEVVCVQRVGWRRVYDLAERAVPAELLAQEPDDATCLARLVAHTGRALGVATKADLADYYRLKQDQVDAVTEAAGLVPVRVQGWKNGAWADPGALATPPRGRHTTTLLSPFDSLVWDRARTSRVFGFDHRLEAYTPKAKRVHGYFAMPLLSGGRLLGRVDPGREGTTLIARQVTLEPWAVTPARVESTLEALRTALWNAAAWVGCDALRIDRLDPSHLTPSIDLSPPA
ncbi:crosslink repair DNA glycosylase YcaQ family protein [Spirillospora sp. NPDC047279]|uniref:winged helix-turn-helix domain-containing protein n=1 Tax=Spirillospora sp. NPDC047279 TaxID=3155478 RepID=UPI0033DEC07B